LKILKSAAAIAVTHRNNVVRYASLTHPTCWFWKSPTMALLSILP